MKDKGLFIAINDIVDHHYQSLFVFRFWIMLNQIKCLSLEVFHFWYRIVQTPTFFYKSNDCFYSFGVFVIALDRVYNPVAVFLEQLLRV